MKIFSLIAFVGVLFLTSCEDNAVSNPPTFLTQTLKKNMRPDSVAGWLYYSFDLDSIIPADRQNSDIWDVKFRYIPYDTTAQGIGNFINVFMNTGPIYFNSGSVNPNGKTKAMIIDTTFDQLSVVPQESLFHADDTSTSERIVKTLQYPETIFTYSGPPNHSCSFIPYKTIVIRSRSNKYYKVQFLSIYKDAPEMPNTKTELGYYWFRFIKADGTKLR